MRVQKEVNSFVHMKNLLYSYIPLICKASARGMGWSHNFPSEKLSSNMYVRAEENLGILYPPSLLLDPWLVNWAL